MTKKITTLDEIRNHPEKVYIRWSNSFAKDQARGYSLRYGSQSEAGLSCVEIDPEWEDWRLLRKITEYEFTFARHCWVITGDYVGRGGDNEPLVANIRLVGEVDKSLLKTDWKKMQIEHYIAKTEARIERIPNEIDKEKAQNMKAYYEQLLEQYLNGEEIPYLA